MLPFYADFCLVMVGDCGRTGPTKGFLQHMSARHSGEVSFRCSPLHLNMVPNPRGDSRKSALDTTAPIVLLPQLRAT